MVRRIVVDKKRRKSMNAFYLGLKHEDRAVFQSITATAFVDNEVDITDGSWTAEFLGKEIVMPLRAGRLWLDWNNAVSITGHDFEVKDLYRRLIESEHPPKTFFDVGANYGTHSILFLTQGISVVTFEPNPSCVDEFRHFCELNEVEPTIEEVAVGETQGNVQFWFPEKETWLGTMVAGTKELLDKDRSLTTIDVELITLDSYVAESGNIPDLIKIDTEGNEIAVLRGARSTLEKHRPIVVFEANLLSDRSELWEFFRQVDHFVFSLPLESFISSNSLGKSEFEKIEGFNFVAIPRESHRLEIVD